MPVQYDTTEEIVLSSLVAFSAMEEYTKFTVYYSSRRVLKKIDAYSVLAWYITMTPILWSPH